jgi:hypothetical protein
MHGLPISFPEQQRSIEKAFIQVVIFSNNIYGVVISENLIVSHLIQFHYRIHNAPPLVP